MRKLIVFLIVIVFVFATCVAAADDYTINEHVKHYSTEYEVASFIAGGVVLILIYAVVCKLIVECANDDTSLNDSIRDEVEGGG